MTDIIPKPKIPIISYSQLDTLKRCEYKWYLKYVEGWKSKPGSYGPAAAKGTMIHRYLELWYTTKDMQSLTDQLNAYLSDGEDIGMATGAYNLVGRYIREFIPHEDKFDVVATEQYFEVDVTSREGHAFKIRGYIDAVLRSRNGQYGIMDHKSISSKFWTEKQFELHAQFPLYAALLPHTEGEWHGQEISWVALNMLNRYEYKREVPTADKLFRRLTSFKNQTQKKNTLIEFGAALDHMKYLTSKEHPHYMKALDKDCKSCEFSDVCAYAQRGVDVVPFLEASHVKDTPPLDIKPEIEITSD